MTALTAESTTNDVVSGQDLTGKTIAITGSSGGLGLETARALGSCGAKLILIARSDDKLAAAKAQLQDQGIQDVACYTIDLADFQSIVHGAKQILNDYSALDVLVNNAGIMACPLTRTVEGFEAQFGTNHMGHFLLTGLLYPLLKAAKSARIVNLSSAGHKISALDLNDLNYQHRDYEKWQAYGQAKTANALFTVGLDQRGKDDGIRAFAVHPGMIATDLGRYLTQEDYEMLANSETTAGGLKTVEQGAATSVWAACHPDLDNKGGLYLENCHVAEPATEGDAGGVKEFAVDPEIAEALWQASLTMVNDAGLDAGELF